MFKNWQQEKAITALVDEAQALAERMQSPKAHIGDGHAAAARFWAGSYGAQGLDLYDIANWKSPDVARFAREATAKIAALRKARAYDSSDGLAIWLHTARAVSQPRIAPAVRLIWQRIADAGPNTDSMADDLLAEEGLPTGLPRRVPAGFGPAEG